MSVQATFSKDENKPAIDSYMAGVRENLVMIKGDYRHGQAPYRTDSHGHRHVADNLIPDEQLLDRILRIFLIRMGAKRRSNLKG
jgi:hypothetical protein